VNSRVFSLSCIYLYLSIYTVCISSRERRRLTDRDPHPVSVTTLVSVDYTVLRTLDTHSFVATLKSLPSRLAGVPHVLDATD
jgi:hypothetical protein